MCREPNPDFVDLLAGCSTACPSHVAPSYQLASVAWIPLIFVGDVEFLPFCAPILILQRRVGALPRGRCDNLIITEPLLCSQAPEVRSLAMRVTTVWDLTSCGLVQVCRRLRWICCMLVPVCTALGLHSYRSDNLQCRTVAPFCRCQWTGKERAQ